MKKTSERASEKLRVILANSLFNATKVMQKEKVDKDVMAKSIAVCEKYLQEAVSYVKNLESKCLTYCNLISIGKKRYMRNVESALNEIGEQEHD